MSDNIQALRDYLAEKVCGWVEYANKAGVPCWMMPDGYRLVKADWTPDTDANQALKLLEETGARWDLARTNYLVVQSDMFFQAVVWTPGGQVIRMVDNHNPLLAICRAVKAWREASE